MSQQHSRSSLRFSEREAQKAAVTAYILEKGYIPKEIANDEVDWFYE
jgi:hypothetical protein